MAEPYDTINAINGGPEYWWRMSSASAPVPNEGTLGSSTSHDLDEASFASFTGTYQAEANPIGDGFGIEFNGGGGLDNASSLSDTDGTMMMVFRTQSGFVNQSFMLGFFNGFDTFYNRFQINGVTNTFTYHIQDGGADDESWAVVPASVTLNDQNVHSIAVQPPSSSTGTPTVYIDGVDVSSSLTFSGDDNVDNDQWWNDFSGTWAVGFRGGVNSSAMDNTIMYEVLAWEGVLTATDIADAHEALTGETAGGEPFTPKTLRGRNRKLYFDFTTS